MHDGFLTALEDEVALRWEELNALFEKFGFTVANVTACAKGLLNL